MRTDEEIMADENIKYLSNVLLELMDYLARKDLAIMSILCKHLERLQDISDNGNSGI
jgi:hypothetical protein